MGTRGRFLLVIIVFIAALFGGSCAQTVCNMTYGELISCKPAATPPNPPPPTAACCRSLAHADMGCLCTYKNSSVLPSLGVDPNLAMQLPDKCHLPHPAHC